MDVCVSCQKGFDEEKEVEAYGKELKTLTRLSNESELRKLSRYLKYFCSFVIIIFLFLVFIS